MRRSLGSFGIGPTSMLGSFWELLSDEDLCDNSSKNLESVLRPHAISSFECQSECSPLLQRFPERY